MAAPPPARVSSSNSLREVDKSRLYLFERQRPGGEFRELGADFLRLADEEFDRSRIDGAGLLERVETPSDGLHVGVQIAHQRPRIEFLDRGAEFARDPLCGREKLVGDAVGALRFDPPREFTKRRLDGGDGGARGEFDDRTGHVIEIAAQQLDLTHHHQMMIGAFGGVSTRRFKLLCNRVQPRLDLRELARRREIRSLGARRRRGRKGRRRWARGCARSRRGSGRRDGLRERSRLSGLTLHSLERALTTRDFGDGFVEVTPREGFGAARQLLFNRGRGRRRGRRRRAWGLWRRRSVALAGRRLEPARNIGEPTIQTVERFFDMRDAIGSRKSFETQFEPRQRRADRLDAVARR